MSNVIETMEQVEDKVFAKMRTKSPFQVILHGDPENAAIIETAIRQFGEVHGYNVKAGFATDNPDLCRMGGILTYQALEFIEEADSPTDLLAVHNIPMWGPEELKTEHENVWNYVDAMLNQANHYGHSVVMSVPALPDMEDSLTAFPRVSLIAV